jgi:hypothetical protein
LLPAGVLDELKLRTDLHVSGDDFAHHQEHLTVFTDLVLFTQVAAGWCLG